MFFEIPNVFFSLFKQLGQHHETQASLKQIQSQELHYKEAMEGLTKELDRLTSDKDKLRKKIKVLESTLTHETQGKVFSQRMQGSSLNSLGMIQGTTNMEVEH